MPVSTPQDAATKLREAKGIVQLVDPHTSELAQPHNIDDTEARRASLSRARSRAPLPSAALTLARAIQSR